MEVIKRDGITIQKFDKTKIQKAITKAFLEVDKKETVYARYIAQDIANYVESLNKTMNVEEIQDLVVEKLMESSRKDVAVKYCEYRFIRKISREINTTDKTILEIIEGKNDYWASENSNKNARLNTTIRDYIAGTSSKDISTRILLPREIVEAHDRGIIHFHDLDYFVQQMHNCDLINLEDMLQNGTVISDVLIEKPHSFSTACNIATQIIAQVASSQYGGQSISLAHLAPFVDVSRQKIRNEVIDEQRRFFNNIKEDSYIKPVMKKKGRLKKGIKKFYDDHQDLLKFIDATEIEKIVESRLKQEISKGIQMIQYQVVTLLTVNGQSPFLTVFLYLNEAKNEREKEDLAILIEEMIRQRIQGVKNEVGVWVSPAFPKLIYVTEEDNIREGSKYYYLTELATQCSAKRLVPDYVSEKVMKELKDGNCYPLMGCRSALTVYYDKKGKGKFYGRFNQGVVTINLPHLALSSGGDIGLFWKLFEERTELCHRALRKRHERLLGTSVNVAPILWRHGALARLDADDVIDELLFNGYSTISLGYAGLYECVKYMTGKSHTDEAEGEAFAIEVMQALNNKCKQWKESENIDYSLYGTPLESTTEKFANALKRDFGVIEGITDRNYVTNSYHVPVFENIDAFEKLRIESKFQRLSPGGAISYVETPDMNKNPQALMEIVKYMYEHIMYAEINTKSDYCHICGFDGEIELIDVNNKLIWRCPNCGNVDTKKMNIVRRTCGYIGTATNGFNQGRLGDIHDRVLHIDDEEIIFDEE